MRVALLLAGDLRLRRPRRAARRRRWRSARARAGPSARAAAARATSVRRLVGERRRAGGRLPPPRAPARSGGSPSTRAWATSPARASIAGSRSPKLSATGSIALVRARARPRTRLAPRRGRRAASAAAKRSAPATSAAVCALDVGAVAVDAALQVGRERGVGVARRVTVSVRVLVVGARAVQRVRPGLEREREAAGQSGGDVLDLAERCGSPSITSYSVDLRRRRRW